MTTKGKKRVPDRIYSTDPGKEPTERRWAEYERALGEEMKQPSMAVDYCDSLRRACGDSLSKAQILYRDLARDLWGPIGLAFLDWVYSTVPDDAILLFALRDAGWLYKVVDTHPRVGRLRFALHINRPVLNIRDDDDRLTSNVGEHELRRYMGDVLAPRNRGRIVIVDTGCWGRVQYWLRARFGLEMQARFVFSHNAYIPSWMEHMGMPAELGEILCDSMETAMPQQFRRVDQLMSTSSGAAPVLALQGHMHRLLYEATSLGLTEAQPGDPYELLRSAVGKHIHARKEGDWTGVLPRNVPTWEGGAVFLRDYPAELRAVNPAHLLPGGLKPRRRKVDLRRLLV